MLPFFLIGFMDLDLLKYLSDFLTERRLSLFDKVLDFRTEYITIALEDIYQPNNASAVLRSCDCFGIQNIHIIENRNEYVIDKEVSMGSHKWLTMNYLNDSDDNTDAAITSLKKQGYRIVATTPHSEEASLQNFDVNKGKFALFFGTELTGLSQQVMDRADEFLKIPMYGFTESFNLSVSAAIILQNLTSRIHNSNLDWKLNEEEKYRLKLEWIRKSIKNVDLIESEYLERKKTGNRLN